MTGARGKIGSAIIGAAIGAALVLVLSPLERLKDVDEENDKAPMAETQIDPGPGKVRLERDVQQRISLSVASLSASTSSEVQEGFLKGLDAAALAAIEAEIGSAQASLSASQAQARRQAMLYGQDQSASLESVETSRAQARSDAVRLQFAVNRIGLEYGPGLATLSDPARTSLLTQIATGRAALVRIDVPGASLDRHAQVRLVQGTGSLQLLGPAASADPRLQSVGVLAILRGPAVSTVASGRTLQVEIAGSRAQVGVFLPSDAVVRWREGLWIYRPLGPELFGRTELTGARPVDGGWFVVQGLKPGDRIVTRGAGTLLGIEHGGAPADED